MKFLLSAQPIDEHGRVGFDGDADAPPRGGVLQSEGPNLNVCFQRMENQLRPRVTKYTAWDLTLEVRE